MDRTAKEATTKAFHCPGLESPKAHVLASVSACSLAKHLKALRWRTPFEAVCHAWTTTPDVFTPNPRHPIPGLNSCSALRGPGINAPRRRSSQQPDLAHPQGARSDSDRV